MEFTLQSPGEGPVCTGRRTPIKEEDIELVSVETFFSG